MSHKYLGELIIQPTQNVFHKIVSDVELKAIIASISTFITYVVFEDTVAIGVLFGFVFIDWITGCWAALKTHTFSSSKFRATIIKLLIYFMIVALFHSLERMGFVFQYLKTDVLAATFLACTEIISILENFTRISKIRLPDWIIKRLKVFQTTGKFDKKK